MDFLEFGDLAVLILTSACSVLKFANLVVWVCLLILVDCVCFDIWVGGKFEVGIRQNLGGVGSFRVSLVAGGVFLRFGGFWWFWF